MNFSPDRRNYYRINDHVGLSYSVLNGTDTKPQTHGEHPQILLATLLSEIDREFNQVTNLLWQENPLQAKALGLLNKKLSLVTEALTNKNGVSADRFEEVQVNISGSGMAFDSPIRLEKGMRLLLSLTLKPSNSLIKLHAFVVDCSAIDYASKEMFRIRVQFDDSETAQEEMIQHIVQRQWSMTRSTDQGD
ncbi:PilZ domain-containing protein [Porticoccus sp.]